MIKLISMNIMAKKDNMKYSETKQLHDLANLIKSVVPRQKKWSKPVIQDSTKTRYKNIDLCEIEEFIQHNYCTKLSTVHTCGNNQSEITCICNN